MAKKAPYTTEANSRNVLTVRCEIGPGWSQDFLLRSDVHHDHPHCDQQHERRHLLEAQSRGAGIIDAGDLFCAMQGKFDKRADKSALRPEHQSGNYLDKLVSTATDFYAPFSENFLVIGRGNHETAIHKRAETDLTERLVERLNERKGSSIQAGGYGGWVRFMFTRGSFRASKLLYYFHGTGGGGPVTRGVIQTNRMAVFSPDPHIILTGHTHDEWIVPIRRQRLSDLGVPYYDEQIHVRTPGYKDGWDHSYAGWEVEKMLGPKPKGAAWLRFSYVRDGVNVEVNRAA